MSKNPIWMRPWWIVIFVLARSPQLFGGEVYNTGFENFTVGYDTINGKESWVGTYNGSKLHGVYSAAQHGVPGIGNAAFIGGFATAITKTSSGNSVYVRKPVTLDPVALNQEIASFRMVFEILDSTVFPIRRDNFEVLIYNQSLQLLAGLQFDNTTLDTSGQPRRLIYRLSWNGSSFQYVITNFTFLPQTLENLEFRINYRTNLWTVSLSDIPIFQDIPFYTGASTRNFGSVMVKMAVSTTTATQIFPGDNVMLFDDYTVRTDDVSTALEITRSVAGAAQLAWNEEANYNYQVLYSGDCVTWKSDLAASNRTATLTQAATFTDPTVSVPTKRFYRIKRTSP